MLNCCSQTSLNLQFLLLLTDIFRDCHTTSSASVSLFILCEIKNNMGYSCLCLCFCWSFRFAPPKKEKKRVKQQTSEIFFKYLEQSISSLVFVFSLPFFLVIVNSVTFVPVQANFSSNFLVPNHLNLEKHHKEKYSNTDSKLCLNFNINRLMQSSYFMLIH